MTSQDTTRIDADRAASLSDRIWEQDILPTLTEYIAIPNKSPHFDPDWVGNGHMHRAFALVRSWCEARSIPGLVVEQVELDGRTPVLWMEIPGVGERNVLLYGHLDKQPEMAGWREGLGPWTPVREGDRLYGRGGADDGYAAFASLAAIELLVDQGLPHPPCKVLIEGCEESGSYDLPAYIDHLRARIGRPDLVVCLDSGAGDYRRLWNTTSLRGMASGDLVVEVLREGVHSGDASGIVPDSFRIARGLLSRIEDPETGALSEDFRVEVPCDRIAQAEASARILGDEVFDRFPFAESAGPVTRDPKTAILNRTWEPTLTVTGQAGLPTLANAGNVLRPMTSLKLSLRLPPTLDGGKAAERLRETLEADAPYGAQVRLENLDGVCGWNAPPLAPWLERALDEASRVFFGEPAAAMGEGGTIPFMGMLGERFPDAQFVITGVLGPESNAHGPNEFLHIPTAKRLTGCVASVLSVT